MNLTVAICTWNRCALLRETLEQITRLAIPDGIEWEMLIVNNNSTDSTEEVVRSFGDRLPIRYVFEPRSGKSNALNAASSRASGEYILWTDDDVLVDPGWVVHYCQAFARHPDAGFFGGPIEPWFEGAVPDWLGRNLGKLAGAYALREFGDRPFLFIRGICPFGANYAVRRKEQLQYTYNPFLGPQPGGPIRGEETAVLYAMLDAGIDGWWVPEARVKHFIPKIRQTTTYLRTYYFGYGEELAARGIFDHYPKVLGVPLFLWRYALTTELKYHFRRYLSGPDVWIEDMISSGRAWGQVSGCIARKSPNSGLRELLISRLFSGLRHTFREIRDNRSIAEPEASRG